MKCHELETYLSDYLEGDLNEPRTAELMEHVAGCEACRREFQAYERQEQGLRRYYGVRLEKALQSPNPLAGEITFVAEDSGSSRRVWIMAAAALLVVALGFGGWSLYRRGVPIGGTMAEVKEAQGRVIVMADKKFAVASPKLEIHDGERVKVAGGGYLALQYADGNILEVREGSQVTLHEYSNRTEVAMNRGHVWAHLPTHPQKKYVVRTAHLTATATGTVFGVEEGIDRTIVQVAEGTVLVECGGKQTLVHAGSSFSSREDAKIAPLADSTQWSRHQEDLTPLVMKNDQPGLSQELPLIVQASEIMRPTPMPLTAPPADQRVAEPPNINDLIDLLPADTRYFLDIRNWPGVRDEFRSSDYEKFLDEPAISEWWKTVHGKEMVDGFMKETHLLEILDVAKLVDGQLTIGVRPDSEFLLIADCVGHEAEVRALVEKVLTTVGGQPDAAANSLNGDSADLMQELLRKNAANNLEDSEHQIRGHVQVARGRLVISSDQELVRDTIERLAAGKSTGFSQTDFARKVRSNCNQARFLMAADLDGLVKEMSEKSEPHTTYLFDFLGLPSLDYLLISPNFIAKGMNQAARVGFKSTRQGAANWLSEPAPMRGLDFFSADVHFFASAIVRSPRQMFFDYLLLLKRTGDDALYDKSKKFFDEHQPFFDALQGEIAIGVDSPILPVPNVKIALEVTDPSGFAQHLAKFIDDTANAFESDGKFVDVKEQEYKGYTIRSIVADGVKFDPSYAFVDDYLILGPGAEFVRDSIDVYSSGHSITHDSRLLSLMPSQPQLNFSILVYQDIARSIPDLMESLPGMGKDSKSLLPDASFFERYRTPGVAYAYAYPSHIDFYMNATAGVDLNLGMAAPLVANWLLPHTNVGQTLDRFNEALLLLDKLQFAFESFQKDTGRAPQSVAELAQAQKYLKSNPVDPFGAEPGELLRMTPSTQQGEIILYSIGPDGVDDHGQVEYNPEQGIDSKGDIVVRVGRK